MVKKYAELYLDARRALWQTEGENASFVARELVCAASGKTAEQMLSDRENYASLEIVARTESFVQRYLSGEPIAYILGQWDFYDMTLTITSDVLIPRDDTMAVTELAIKKALFADRNPRILDLCTGSGCIGLAIARRVADARLTLADISPAALKVARRNAIDLRLNARAACIVLDAKKPAPDFIGKFHLIVANPPYITSAEMLALDRSVRDFEPHLALHGGEDGLDFYRAIIGNYTSALLPRGCFCFEIGKGQETAVCGLLERGGFEILELRRDSADIIRAILAQKREED